MRKLVIIILLTFSYFKLFSQPPQLLPSYTINNITLPADLDKQVCISGITFFNGRLCLVSERCPMIFVLNSETGNVDSIVRLNVSQEFEMEGITFYKNKLYLVSENIPAVYEVNDHTAEVKSITLSIPMPPKSKEGDGMEGIAANESNNKFYLLRERNEDQSKAQIYTFNAVNGPDADPPSLKFESILELPLESRDWRYSDICFDSANSRLICLKSYSKGKLRQLFIETISIDSNGSLSPDIQKNINVEKLSESAGTFKSQGYSTNLEGITVDHAGNIFLVSDNHSGKAVCDLLAKEKTILLRLSK
ncbi:MAG: esterase-like activity of phytase family protein [Chitinophagaceae bacterium]